MKVATLQQRHASVKRINLEKLADAATTLMRECFMQYGLYALSVPDTRREKTLETDRDACGTLQSV